ncbi:hypothetical protein EVAR_68450_1 [Eumeta japonica]|uniref:Uncharacterized protein n=1 Tax=Eumeta variegata TaxID=151549 RepID=A0A4C1ZX34_EUMVA|nr:hypothetical protein EVAR_68450_1 [Eumeta japonica]
MSATGQAITIESRVQSKLRSNVRFPHMLCGPAADLKDPSISNITLARSTDISGNDRRRAAAAGAGRGGIHNDPRLQTTLLAYFVTTVLILYRRKKKGRGDARRAFVHRGFRS